MRRGGKRTHGVVACVGADTFPEGPLHGVVDGLVEDVGEEGDNCETELYII